MSGDLEALAMRCEQATAEQQYDLIDEAYQAIAGERPCSVGTALGDWLAPYVPFRRKLDAEAFADAALSLVPEGMLWSINNSRRGIWATVYSSDEQVVCGNNTPPPTPALAITAAALRARSA